MLQDQREIDWFIEILRRENVRSYLEVGSKFGGSFWRVANSLPKGSRVVSIDLPQGDGSFKESKPALALCVEQLRSMGYDAHLLLRDSASAESVTFAKRLGPFDAVFIDGCHTLKGVTADWRNYGPMSRIVAFHDIGWVRPAESGKNAAIEVPKLWAELKAQYVHDEIMESHKDNGIGVLWRS